MFDNYLSKAFQTYSLRHSNRKSWKFQNWWWNWNLHSVHTVDIRMQKKVRQKQLSITFPPHVYVTAACGSVLWKLRMDSKGNRLPGLSQPTPKQKWEKCGRAGGTETPKELSKNRERKKKPIKTYVLGPWRPMSCLKSPRLNLQRPQVRLRGYQPLFGVNHHCLSRYVPLHLNGLTCLMQSGGWKQKANVYQRLRSGFSSALLLAETQGFLSRPALGVSVWRWGVRGSQWGVEVLNPVILLLPVTLARCSAVTAEH